MISGTVAGKADLRAKEIVIASGARLGGELVARSPNKPEIAADATIAGPVREIETEVNIRDPEDLPRMAPWLAVAAVVVLLLGAFLLGVLAQLAVPGPLSRGAAGLRTELWGSIGRGLAWLLLVPAIGALLFASLIGIPAGVILIAMFVVLLALASVTAAYAIGLWVRNRRSAAAPEPGIGGRIGWDASRHPHSPRCLGRALCRLDLRPAGAAGWTWCRDDRAAAVQACRCGGTHCRVAEEASEHWLPLPVSPAHGTRCSAGAPPSPDRSAEQSRVLRKKAGRPPNVAFFLTHGGAPADKAFREMQVLAARVPISTLVVRDQDAKAGRFTSAVASFAAALRVPQAA